MRTRVAIMGSCLALLAGCGSDDTPGRAGGSGGAPDGGGAGATGATRSYALASSGARMTLTPEPGIFLTPADLATDVDAVLIHQEFYGLPWDAFEAGTTPPAEWVDAMDGLVADTKTLGRPVFLQLQLVQGGSGRHYLADRAVVAGGKLTTVGQWSAECFDFSSAPDASSKRAAYLAYVDWMVKRFEPRWVNVAIEINMFADCGDSAWNALVDVERGAYDAAKAAKTDVIAFPSIQLEILYGWAGCASGDRNACFDASYAKLANLKRDRFAVTSLPYQIKELTDPAALPDDWFTRAGDRGGEKTLVAEAGWLGAPLIAELGTQCLTAIDCSEPQQLAFFDRVIAAANQAEIELVTWPSNRDLIPTQMMTNCPCDFDANWCAMLASWKQAAGSDPQAQAGVEYNLKRFGAMGLRRYDGTPRSPFIDHWNQARALPWAGAQ